LTLRENGSFSLSVTPTDTPAEADGSADGAGV
jgi:hypothetical protein